MACLYMAASLILAVVEVLHCHVGRCSRPPLNVVADFMLYESRHCKFQHRMVELLKRVARMLRR